MDLLGEVCRQMAEERSEDPGRPRYWAYPSWVSQELCSLYGPVPNPCNSGVSRELRLRIKEALDAAGIELPYRLVVYEGKERGQTRPLRLTGLGPFSSDNYLCLAAISLSL